MTRDERIAAGWVECWGVYCEGAGWWLGMEGGWTDYRKPTSLKRYNFVILRAAKEFTLNQPGMSWARHFWRRKKPKAPPPLKVGDIVLVRLQVGDVHRRDSTVLVEEAPGGRELESAKIIRMWARREDCERIKP